MITTSSYSIAIIWRTKFSTAYTMQSFRKAPLDHVVPEKSIPVRHSFEHLKGIRSTSPSAAVAHANEAS
ncbi:hypothetical protein BRADI_1g33503v3 [Brachypodium distachyon]|uniref:Uncharacterized protein n=1 Tax=Brachypodium distachyon TaxID=15368 RepID=A0A0Q3JZ67_BRADI|nr:hypothetical protein BRADI_1g33503v3 [Brachypodium distachyon]